MRLYPCKVMVVALLTVVLPVVAQQPQPTLQQLLTTVQGNYAEYLHTLPNLYAQESMFSSVTFITSGGGIGNITLGGGIGNSRNGEDQHIAYDSIYRLRRVAGSADEREMEETRQVTAVDHKPVTENVQLMVPYLVLDSQYAPNVFWPGWGKCFDYKLGATRKWQGKTVLVLEYETGHQTGLQVRCPLTEPVSGRALVDPETMTMVRFEQTRSRHIPDRSTIQKLHISPEVFGVWRWSIDYEPATLGGKTFRLPKTITSGFELFGPHVLWSSVSNYSHYQLADVHSKVLLPDGTEAK